MFSRQVAKRAQVSALPRVQANGREGHHADPSLPKRVHDVAELQAACSGGEHDGFYSSCLQSPKRQQRGLHFVLVKEDSITKLPGYGLRESCYALPDGRPWRPHAVPGQTPLQSLGYP